VCEYVRVRRESADWCDGQSREGHGRVLSSGGNRLPIAGLVVPYAAGVLRRMIGRCMIDLTPGAPCLTSHVPGVFCLGTRQDPCTILHVQLRTDNLVTGQHREQHSREFIERREVRERGRRSIRRSGIDWNYTRGLQSGFGYRTALGCLGLLRQYAKTNSTSGFGAICRTKYLARLEAAYRDFDRGRLRWSKATGSWFRAYGSSNTTAGFHRGAVNTDRDVSSIVSLPEQTSFSERSDLHVQFVDLTTRELCESGRLSIGRAASISISYV